MLSLICDNEQSTDETETLAGKVKWFDASRGFGFVLVQGFEAEFLLHQNVLQESGRETVIEGSYIEFKYETSANGLRVTEIISIKKPEAQDERVDDGFADLVSELRFPARVKWYDVVKGYGFVNCFGSAEDVFVGSGVLSRSGFRELTPGQALSIQICEQEGRKRVHQIHDWQTK